MTTTSPASSRSVHAAILILAAASFLSGAALRICDGLIPRLASDFTVSHGVAGRVVIVFAISYSVMQLVFGPLGDRFGKVRLISAALFGCAALALLASVARGFDALLAARIGWGMASAGVIPLAMAWIGDAVPYEERQPTLARLLTGTLSGMMAGQLAGGFFGESALGWRGAFATMGVGYAVLFVLLLVRMRSMTAAAQHSAERRPVLRQWQAVLGSAWSRKVLAAALVEGVFLLGPLAYMPSMLQQRFGLALSTASAMVALYAVGGLVYAIFARRIVTTWGERRMVLAGGWIMGAGELLWLVSPVSWTVAPVALAIGFGTYLYHNTLQTNATQMTPSARGTAVALFAFCLFFGQALGVSLAGYAFDHLGRGPMLLAPAIALPLAGWAFSRALRTRDDVEKSVPARAAEPPAIR
jgi:predicted MFS family arabinose efflux permease